jgi:hypothetical protein
MRKLWVIDWKSSKAFYPEMSMQLAAYLRAAMDMQMLPTGDKGVGILRLDKETGIPEFHDCTPNLDKDAERFIALAHYFNLSNEYKEPKRKPKFDTARWYDIEGDRFPSVTTILGCLDKPALKQWASNCAVEYIKDHIADIQHIDATPEDVAAILKDASTAYAKYSKKATDTGTLVHDAIEAYLSKTGKHDDILAQDDKAQNSFLSFLEWEKRVELEPIHLEHVLYSKNARYAGRVDFIGYAEIKENTDGK